MASKEFRRGFAHLAKLGLSYNSWLYHPQIKELTDLARAFPETTIIMDHCGGPLGIGPYAGRRDEIFKTWEANVREIAKCPNVNVKLGGLGMKVNGFGFEKDDLPPTSEKVAATFKPYVETCIKYFGARAVDVRKQLPGRQGLVQLRRELERLQAPGCGSLRRREGEAVQGHGGARLSAQGLTPAQLRLF